MGLACWLQVAVQEGHGLLSCLTYLELGRALENRQSLMVLCADSWAGLTHGCRQNNDYACEKVVSSGHLQQKTLLQGQLGRNTACMCITQSFALLAFVTAL